MLAWDVCFKTAPGADDDEPATFVAMGDLGPGDDSTFTLDAQPSYCFDVFDLMHRVARDTGPDAWLVLGDVDNDSDGDPNAYDPFFFGLYNAFTNRPGRYNRTSAYDEGHGNFGICISTWNASSIEEWERAYVSSFKLPWVNPPPEFKPMFKHFDELRKQGKKTPRDGGCYAFRYGKAAFYSLPEFDCGWDGWRDPAAQAVENLAIDPRASWIVAFYHNGYASYGGWDAGNLSAVSRVFLGKLVKGGVRLALGGHIHEFRADTKYRDDAYAAGSLHANHLQTAVRGIVVGTGGFGDDYIGTSGDDPVKRPGFVLGRIHGDVLEHWKLDTQKWKEWKDGGDGWPGSRIEDFGPRVVEYCRIWKDPNTGEIAKVREYAFETRERELAKADPVQLAYDRLPRAGRWARLFAVPAAATGKWQSVDGGHRLCPLGGKRVLDMDITGTTPGFRMWKYDPNPKFDPGRGQADPLTDLFPQGNLASFVPSLKKVFWNAATDHLADVQLGCLGSGQLLVSNRASGKFAIFDADAQFRCVAWGEWPRLKGPAEMIHLGGDLVLDWNPSTEECCVWTYQRPLTEAKAPSIPFVGVGGTSSEPLSRCKWTSVRYGHRLVAVRSSSSPQILCWHWPSGWYRLWTVDSKQLMEKVAAAWQYKSKVAIQWDPLAGGPVREGRWSSLEGDKQLVFLDEDKGRILEWEPRTRKYRLWKLNEGPGAMV
ncbi:MAG: hypothetical protein FJ109_20040 [Deltaproteobacteria bacterium]|nr:hypothetical protein [Deltaproteobacteria bacterium]